MKKAKSVKLPTASESGSDRGVEVKASVWSLGGASIMKCEGGMSVYVELNDSNTQC